jgi:vancomycin resistance protein YoaR
MEEATETSADAPSVPEGDRRRRPWVLPALLVPIVLLVILVIAWAIDSSSSGVARHVRLAGTAIGGSSETELASEVTKVAKGFSDTPVRIVVGKDRYDTTAAEIGLMVDTDRTAENALDVGSHAFVLFRPFEWVGAFFSEREVPIAYQVNDDQLTSATLTLEGDDRVPPTEPTVELVDGRFQVVPGKEGSGLDPADIAAALPKAAQTLGRRTRIQVEARRVALPPLGSPKAAEEAAAGAEALVDKPVELTTSAGNKTVSSDLLRTWVTLTTNPDGTVQVDLDPARVQASIKGLFSSIDGRPKDASFTVVDGKPVIVPEQTGKVCCGPDSASRIITALRAGTRSVGLDLVEGQPSFTAAEATKLGIVQEIGSPTAFGPTTKHACCESRVQNIHRIADLVRGVVIKPGQSFSINNHVGQRTVAKGFTTGGAIMDGKVTTGIGGGISQFATTLFNAALYAGLDFGEYQSHSLVISRYPRGHEATLSWTHPDLVLKNTTPYGVLIWPTYTDTTITVHLYSTPYASVTIGATSDSPAGNCTKVTTPRHRVYPDGRTKDDSVYARYRPAEGVNC